MESIIVNLKEASGKYNDPEWQDIDKFRMKFFNDCPHVGVIKTDYRLCNEILDQLSDSVDLNDKHVLILFNPEFYATIHTRWPQARITLITGSKKASGLKFAGVERVIFMDPFNDIELLGELKMKFDVIVGNPPFQAPKGNVKNKMCGGFLWKRFIEKSLSLTKDKGYMALIHPGQWRKPDNATFDLLHKYNIKYLEMHNLKDGFKTFGVATGYDWYVIQKTYKFEKTKIKDVDGNIIEQDLSCATFIPNSNFNLFNTLLAGDNEQKCEVIFNRSSYGTDKPHMSHCEDDQFKYPCVYGITKKGGLKLFYSKLNSNGHFDVPKIIFPKSKYTDAIIDDSGKYGLCEFVFGLKINSKEEGENIKKALLSDKFKKIWAASEWIYNSKEWRIFQYFKKDFWKEFI